MQQLQYLTALHRHWQAPDLTACAGAVGAAAKGTPSAGAAARRCHSGIRCTPGAGRPGGLGGLGTGQPSVLGVVLGRGCSTSCERPAEAPRPSTVPEVHPPHCMLMSSGKNTFHRHSSGALLCECVQQVMPDAELLARGDVFVVCWSGRPRAQRQSSRCSSAQRPLPRTAAQLQRPRPLQPRPTRRLTAYPCLL